MASNQKDPSLDAKHQVILVRMQQLPENKKCADCHGPAPRWASTNLGCFLCISCSGIHRKLGVHISTVRSVTLDTWTPAQVEHFQTLGNAKSAAIYEANLPSSFRRPASGDAVNMERFIRDKYERRLFAPDGGGASRQALFTPTNAREYGRSIARDWDITPAGSVGHSSSTSMVQFTNMQSSYAPQRSFHHTRGLGPRPQQLQDFETSDPYQRAKTMKQILDMGFHPNIAARALKASNGNLQLAVEWVLENEASAQAPKDRPVPGAHRQEGGSQGLKPAFAASTHDVLKFDGPEKPSTAAVALPTIPGAVSERNLAEPPAWSACEDDFAEFGAFESAAPTCINASSSLTNMTQTLNEEKGQVTQDSATGRAMPSSLQKISGSDLASLYAKAASTSTRPPSSASESKIYGSGTMRNLSSTGTLSELSSTRGKGNSNNSPSGRAQAASIVQAQSGVQTLFVPSALNAGATGLTAQTTQSAEFSAPVTVTGANESPESRRNSSSEQNVTSGFESSHRCSPKPPLVPNSQSASPRGPENLKSTFPVVRAHGEEDPFAGLASLALSESKARSKLAKQTAYGASPLIPLGSDSSAVSEPNVQPCSADDSTLVDVVTSTQSKSSTSTTANVMIETNSENQRQKDLLEQEPQSPVKESVTGEMEALFGTVSASSAPATHKSSKELSLDELLGI